MIPTFLRPPYCEAVVEFWYVNYPVQFDITIYVTINRCLVMYVKDRHKTTVQYYHLPLRKAFNKIPFNSEPHQRNDQPVHVILRPQ